MKIIHEVLAELFSMFWADARMTTEVLALVAVVAALIKFTSINSLWLGGLLLLGSLAIVLEAAYRETRKRARN